MQEQRRHQRIRFSFQPSITIGFAGVIGQGTVENLSLSGLMVRTTVALAVGKTFGCEFSVFGSPSIDVSAVTVSRVGDLFGARFQSGPISELLIKEAMENALGAGHASAVGMHYRQGRKIMRIVGGLNSTLMNDFDYNLSKVGVDELDVSAVTRIDQDGLALCRSAVARYGVSIGEQSDCFAIAWGKQEHRQTA